MASPLLSVSDTEPLPVRGEAEDENSQASVGGGEGLRPVGAGEKPVLSDPGTPPSRSSSGPGSPPIPSASLRCAAHRRQLKSLPASPRLSEAPGQLQAYEVELEMRACGLPKLRIKKVDTSPQPEPEPLRRDQSVPPCLGAPRGSKSSGRPDTSYLSPPCLRPAHGSPSKSGGQTYICQSCTPTHCPSSTPSPFQTDVGVPWTPSPKRSGKTTPDTIKDWPRRKRAVDGSLGAAMGTDLAACGSLLRPEGKEPGLELGVSRTPLLGDFELEGVCQLPDQSPPGDSVSEAEEFWVQSVWASRKRLLSGEDEAQCEAKRVCDQQREDSGVPSEARSPAAGAWQLLSSGEDEAGVSGSTPPPGHSVRSCLSARGLQALTQSPLLFRGRTPSSQGRDATDEEGDVFSPAAEDSPFSRAFSRTRPVSRTYSRKKLIS